MTRILVTGATGLIGAPTLAPLIASGREVHAVTSRRPRTGAAAPVHWHVCDLLDARATEALASQVAATELLHLAWYAEPGRVWSSPENLRWVEASLRLLQAFTEAGGRRAVLAGSCAEYAWQESTLCVESSTPCRPATLYGAAKHGLHVIAESYAAELGLSLAWGRIFFVFGPGEHEARLGGSVARSLLRGEPAICSHGEQRRDFIYSGDLADAFVALLRSPVEGAVNVASGRATTVRELVEALAKACGRPDLPRFGARPAVTGEPAELLADITRLRDEVGWTPAATLEQRAHDAIEGWRALLKSADVRRAPA